MKVRKVSLIAPNSLPIVGVKLNDGSVTEFEYEYASGGVISSRFFILPEGSMNNVVYKNGDLILVDSDGNEWVATDVELHTLCP
jgi:hypothetical protein